MGGVSILPLTDFLLCFASTDFALESVNFPIGHNCHRTLQFPRGQFAVRRHVLGQLILYVPAAVPIPLAWPHNGTDIPASICHAAILSHRCAVRSRLPLGSHMSRNAGLQNLHVVAGYTC